MIGLSAPTNLHLGAPSQHLRRVPCKSWSSYRKVAGCARSIAAGATPSDDRSPVTSEVFNYDRHTLSSLYIGKQPKVKQLDHLQRRMNKDIREIAEVGDRTQNPTLLRPRAAQ